MLYIFDEIDLIEDDFLDDYKSLLSAERYEKMQRLRTPQKKKASAVAYLMLRLALSELYGINDAVEFVYEDKGKPLLKSHPDIHFNLSHSKNAVTCVVSNDKIGVDVQYITHVKDSLAKRVLTDSEYARFKAFPTPDEYFCEIWTIKESYLKLIGKGITTDLRDIVADEIMEKMIYRHKDYYYCVCGSQVLIKHIRREDFEQLYTR